MTDLAASETPEPPEPEPEPEPEPRPRVRVRCPGCGARAFFTDAGTRCGKCAAHFRIVPFAPLLDAPEMAAGTGRCANHPGKDAMAPCGRCGAFACDVCVTRTGELILCPDCFGLLHDRGQLETTQTSRTRWDYVTLLLCLANSFVCFFAAPISLTLSIWLLARMRREPWIRVGFVVAALVISVLQMGVIALMVAGAFA